MKATLQKIVLSLAGFALAGSYAMAQISSADALVDNMTTQVKSIGSKIFNLVLILGLLAGIVMSLPALVKYLRGEHDSANALTKVGIGIIIFVAIVFVIKSVAGFA